MFELLNHRIQITQKEYTGEFFQKLIASDGIASSGFSHATSASNDGQVIAVSAYATADKGSSSGSVYIFTKQANGSYIQFQKLTAFDGAANDYFGVSVSISADGSVIVVGSYNDDDRGSDSGSVYIFTKQANGSYSQFQKLTASDGVANDKFGVSVSISTDASVIVVGAYYDDDKGLNSGSLYVFKRQDNGNYGQVQKLTSTVGISNGRLGNSVAMSSDGGVIAAGAYGADGAFTASGAVDVFSRDSEGVYSWSQQLRAADQTASAMFGISVATDESGDVLVIGAYLDDAKGTDSGSAYIFTRQVSGLYTQKQKLTAPDGLQTDYFGISTAVLPGGGTVFIGASSDDDKALSAGSVYQFDRQVGGSYEFTRKLVSPTQVSSAQLGRSIAVSSGNPVVVVGAVGDTGKVASTGAVYIFK